MKVSNIRKRLLAALAAGGLVVFTPTAPARGANLDENLVVNGGFENVDLATTSFYNAPKINHWSGKTGFAYSHDNSGNNVPDFAAGAPLAGGGHWYFTPNNNTNDSLANALRQDIDVSAGPAADAIASGAANFTLSAYFSTYLGQADRGIVQAQFLNAGNAVLATALVATPVDQVLAEWTQFTASEPVPVGTSLIRMASWGEVFAGSTGGPDGFTDNIDLRISIARQGDFDADGDVDGADFLTWQRNVGRIGEEATKARGNANGDGAIDGLDLAIWKASFGGGAVPIATAIPEPSSVVLAGVGLAGFAIARSGRRRT